MSDETLRAQIYGSLHRGNPGDVAFYKAVCRPNDAVLELGCGGGRIMAAIADGAQGARVGLDISQSQLDLARSHVGSRDVRWLRADMRDFHIEATFDRIIIPYNGFYTLRTDAGMVSCLANASRHLTPDGVVVFDAYAVTDVAMESHVGPEEPEFLAQLSVGPYDVVVWESERPIAEPRSIEVVYRYDLTHRTTGEQRTIEDGIAHHFLRPNDLHRVIRQAGLKLERLDGDFEGSAFHETSDHYVVTARRR